MNIYQRIHSISNKVSKRMDRLFNQLRLHNLDEEVRFDNEEQIKLLAEIQTVFNLLDREGFKHGTRH